MNLRRQIKERMEEILKLKGCPGSVDAYAEAACLAYWMGCDSNRHNKMPQYYANQLREMGIEVPEKWIEFEDTFGRN